MCMLRHIYVKIEGTSIILRNFLAEEDMLFLSYTGIFVKQYLPNCN